MGPRELRETAESVLEPRIQSPPSRIALSLAGACGGSSENNHQDFQICSDSTNPREVAVFVWLSGPCCPARSQIWINRSA